MRCITCQKLSFKIICKKCRKNHLTPNPTKKQFEDLTVISLFQYDEIEDLLKTKYHSYGNSVYEVLGEIAIKRFFCSFDFEERIDIVPIDDKPDIFSHTAILAKKAKTKYTKPLFNSLRSENKIQYAGKDLIFRKSNPKGFYLKKKPKNSVILIDDIVTTGTTLLEAKKVLEEKDITVLFAITIAS